MKLYAPKYYKKFQCIADKCEHSCCIGWEIDIDENTLNKYASLSHPYSLEINDSIVFDELPHFKLILKDRCSHLNEKGLCNIIINCGEECLCDICREHPRFYNFTNQGKEVGLGMSCEAACDLIVSSDDYDQIIEIGDVSGELLEYEYDAVVKRDLIFGILKNASLNITEKIYELYKLFNVKLYDLPICNLIENLEYLNSEDKELFLTINTLSLNHILSDELTRILAYFIYRHCSEAYDEYEFFVSLSFAVFCTGLISSLSNPNNIKEIARIVSEEIEYSEENTEKIKSLFY